jgi:hypothetical protein
MQNPAMGMEMQQPMMGMQNPAMGMKMQQPMMGMQNPAMGMEMQQPMMGMQNPAMGTEIQKCNCENREVKLSPVLGDISDLKMKKVDISEIQD